MNELSYIINPTINFVKFLNYGTFFTTVKAICMMYTTLVRSTVVDCSTMPYSNYS